MTAMLTLLLLSQFTNTHADPGGEWTEWHRVLGPDIQISGWFGRELAGLGDVNADGHDDYATSTAEINYNGQTFCGAVYGVDGRTGTILWVSYGQPYDQLGSSLTAVGDLNGDGRTDLAASRGRGSNLPVGAPFIRMLDGKTGATLFEIPRPIYTIVYGSTTCPAGDWNQDGVPDLAVGDPSYFPPGQRDLGAVFIHSGVDGALLQRIEGFASGHQFGMFISGGGDADGDGRTDLMVRGYWQVGGSLHLIQGGTGAEIYRLDSLTGNGYFGSRSAFLHDLDGDDSAELLIKDGLSGPRDQGEVDLFSGRTGTLIRRWFPDHYARVDNFGNTLSQAGDVDADGFEDILISDSVWQAHRSLKRVHLYSGADGRLLHTLVKSPPPPTDTGFGFSYGLVGGFDVTGDGRPDVIAGDVSEDVQGIPDVGSVSVLSFDPYLRASAHTVSSSQGGAIHFDLDFPASEALRPYRLLASTDVAGDPLRVGKPWIRIHDVLVPLVETPIAYRTLLDPPRALSGAHGLLDVNAHATASLDLLPGTAAAAVGRSFRFAAVTLAAPGQAGRSSAAVHLRVTP